MRAKSLGHQSFPPIKAKLDIFLCDAVCQKDSEYTDRDVGDPHAEPRFDNLSVGELLSADQRSPIQKKEPEAERSGHPEPAATRHDAERRANEHKNETRNRNRVLFVDFNPI